MKLKFIKNDRMLMKFAEKLLIVIDYNDDHVILFHLN